MITKTLLTPNGKKIIMTRPLWFCHRLTEHNIDDQTILVLTFNLGRLQWAQQDD